MQVRGSAAIIDELRRGKDRRARLIGRNRDAFLHPHPGVASNRARRLNRLGDPNAARGRALGRTDPGMERRHGDRRGHDYLDFPQRVGVVPDSEPFAAHEVGVENHFQRIHAITALLRITDPREPDRVGVPKWREFIALASVFDPQDRPDHLAIHPGIDQPQVRALFLCRQRAGRRCRTAGEQPQRAEGQKPQARQRDQTATRHAGRGQFIIFRTRI